MPANKPNISTEEIWAFYRDDPDATIYSVGKKVGMTGPGVSNRLRKIPEFKELAAARKSLKTSIRMSGPNNPLQREDVKEKCRAALKAVHATPEFKKKQGDLMRERVLQLNATPGYKEFMAQRSLQGMLAAKRKNLKKA